MTRGTRRILPACTVLFLAMALVGCGTQTMRAVRWMDADMDDIQRFPSREIPRRTENNQNGRFNHLYFIFSVSICHIGGPDGI